MSVCVCVRVFRGSSLISTAAFHGRVVSEAQVEKRPAQDRCEPGALPVCPEPNCSKSIVVSSRTSKRVPPESLLPSTILGTGCLSKACNSS